MMHEETVSSVRGYEPLSVERQEIMNRNGAAKPI
jgi:hypothetical protein